MAKNEHSGSNDPDIMRLQAKSQEGTINVVGEILKDPKIQEVIKNALLWETVKNSVVMACLLIGFLKLYDVTKIVVGFNWIGDLVLSIILVLVGAVYIIKNMGK